MQKFIYEIANKILMNEVERDLLKFVKTKKRIFFDIGCYSGNFTSNLIKFNNKIRHQNIIYLIQTPSRKNIVSKF